MLELNVSFLGHVFLTFFKVFTLTVIFGLFNGLVLLPVLLSLVGPSNSSNDHSSEVSTSSVEFRKESIVGDTNIGFITDEDISNKNVDLSSSQGI